MIDINDIDSKSNVGSKSPTPVIGLALSPVLIKAYIPKIPIPSYKHTLIALPRFTIPLLSPILFVLKKVTNQI